MTARAYWHPRVYTAATLTARACGELWQPILYDVAASTGYSVSWALGMTFAPTDIEIDKRRLPLRLR